MGWAFLLSALIIYSSGAQLIWLGGLIQGWCWGVGLGMVHRLYLVWRLHQLAHGLPLSPDI